MLSSPQRRTLPVDSGGTDWQPAWTNRRVQQNKRSKKQERDRAKEIGGRAQPGSGSSSRAPQDVRQDFNEQGDAVLEQLKYTDKDRITIKVKDLLSQREDALRFGREPGMVVEFTTFGLRITITQETIK